MSAFHSAHNVVCGMNNPSSSSHTSYVYIYKFDKECQVCAIRCSVAIGVV